MNVSRRSGIFFVVLGLGACATLEWEPGYLHRSEPVAGAERVGSAECGVCHEDVQGHPRIAAYHADCESCHGGGSLHSESEDPLEVRYPSNTDCLSCHAVGYDTHLQWGTGEHSRAGLYCSDCHNPHDPNRSHLRIFSQPGSRDMDVQSRLCIECHRDVSAQFNFPSHHPVREGGMGCTSCHDAHEDSRVAHGTGNQLCAECHQDVVGPWVFEHPPVVEDCLSCHAPHGAVTGELLHTIEAVGCLSCHTLNDEYHHDFGATGIVTGPPGGGVPNSKITTDFPNPVANPGEVIQPNEARTYLQRCTNCHSAIHGSYSDAKLRF